MICARGSPLKEQDSKLHILTLIIRELFSGTGSGGDAAGYCIRTDREGIYQAILSGKEVAKGILDKEYTCPGIKHLLKIKNRQERLLYIFGINQYIPHIVFNNAVPFLLKIGGYAE